MLSTADQAKLKSPEGYTVPSNETAKEFGKIVVRMNGNNYSIEATVLMEPQGSEAEGWQTGVALDASASMKAAFGKALEGKVPPDVAKSYIEKGWVDRKVEDGRTVETLKRTAFEDAIARGFLRFTPNVVEPIGREFLRYLAGSLDADGGTTLIYWACGDGSKIEVVGDPTEDDCATLELKGPSTVSFGKGTMLQPAMQYFIDRFADASRGMYVFITDGRLDDLDKVKAYTTNICKEIAAGKRNPVKCVLVGVGYKVDESQMEELDDLDTGTEIDVWDHKIAKEMRALVEIFAEVVSENQIVAPTGSIYEDSGSRVRFYSDGLPARLEFDISTSSKGFELEVAGQRIKQKLF